MNLYFLMSILLVLPQVSNLFSFSEHGAYDATRFVKDFINQPFSLDGDENMLRHFQSSFPSKKFGL